LGEGLAMALPVNFSGVLASAGLRGVQCSRCRSFPGGSVDVVSFDFVFCKVEFSEFQFSDKRL
jgi:hypothetical protein